MTPTPETTEKKRHWRWVPIWVSKSKVVLELLGQMRVLEAKNALLERERSVNLHQLEWFAGLVSELRAREAALFQANFGVTMPAPEVTVSAPDTVGQPAVAATVPNAPGIRDIMNTARQAIETAGKQIDPFADPLTGEAPGEMFEDMGDEAAMARGIQHDTEGSVVRPAGR